MRPSIFEGVFGCVVYDVLGSYELLSSDDILGFYYGIFAAVPLASIPSYSQ